MSKEDRIEELRRGIEDNVYECAGRSFLTFYNQMLDRGLLDGHPSLEQFKLLGKEYMNQLETLTSTEVLNKALKE